MQRVWFNKTFSSVGTAMRLIREAVLYYRSHLDKAVAQAVEDAGASSRREDETPH